MTQERAPQPPPLWLATAATKQYPALEGPASFDVVVVGGGIAGMTTALLTQQAGLRVGLLEAARIGQGATGRSTVKVTAGHSLKYSEIERLHGSDAARLYAESNQQAVEHVGRLVDELKIDCDFEWRRHIVYAETPEEREAVSAEVDAEQRAGLRASFEDGSDLPFQVTGCLVLERQAQFHPLRYIHGLADAFVAAGGAIYEDTRALGVDAGDPCVVRTGVGDVRAEHVVIATQSPITNRELLFAKMRPIEEFAVAGPIDRGSMPNEMYISAGSVTHSIRTFDDDGEQFLIVVGEKHPLGENPDEEGSYEALRRWASDTFGMTEVRYRWSTYDLWTIDRLPYIGRIGGGNAPIWVATGFGGWGMTNGTVAGLVLRDLIQDRPTEYSDLYDPSRGDITKGAGAFLKGNLKVASHWIGDRLTTGEDAETLGPDEAAIVLQDGGEHVACYRDPEGRVHAVSASCTHQGCLVSWNTAERTWDCPCHGSRFGIDGEVIAAPAVHPLPPREVSLP
jgi:glycine/D-amino acid oxidase-like deaminating enzyme/nitrite reductase/ring-hydroxylating ferredoxin subunit